MNDAQYSIPQPQPAPQPYSAWQGWYAPQPLPPAPPEKDYPVPAARHTPLIWAAALVTLTIVSLILGLTAQALNPPAPTRAGTPFYSGSLAQDDGAFAFTTINGQCAFTHGGLDAIANETNHAAPVCALHRPVGGSFWLSVRVAPQSQLGSTLGVALFFHQGAQALFIDDKGAYEITERDQVSNELFEYVPVGSGSATQWHADGVEANTIVAQVKDGVITLGVNGVQVAQVSDSGGVPRDGVNDDIVLGAAGATNGSGEALYTDLVVNRL